MPSLCLYGMCHNLGSSSYQGYCNENHMKRAQLQELKEQVAKLKKELLKQVSTSSSHCEAYKESPHE